MPTYGTLNNVPSDVIDVRSGTSVAFGADIERTVAYVGGMDTAAGSANTGELYEVDSTSDAEDLFGADSELYEATRIGYANGVAQVYAVAVPETQSSESFSSSAQGTVSDAPLFDPNVQYDHEITAQDGSNNSVDVAISYETQANMSPSAGQITINPVTGDWKANTSDTYDISYTTGDYTTALQPAVNENPRVVTALTEDGTVMSELETDVTNAATNFNFMNGVGGAGLPVDVGNYSDSLDERRISLVAHPRGYVDTAESRQARTAAGVGAFLASKDLGDTATYEALQGYTGLVTSYDNQDASDLIDEQVIPLQERDEILVLKDMTTSTDARFERVYASQIIDEVTEITHLTAQEYIGLLNIETNRVQLEADLDTSFASLQDERPPLLDAFDVSVAEDDTNADKVNVNIGVSVVDVIDTVDVTLTIGNVITNEGAA